MQVTELIYLLVHPGYIMSRRVGSLSLGLLGLDDSAADSPSSNVEIMRELWLDAIEEVDKSPSHYLAIVNSVELSPDDIEFMKHPYSNPYRALYRQIIERAAMLEKGFFLFSPTIREANVAKETLEGRLVRATWGSNSIIYEPAATRLVAFGEHAGLEVVMLRGFPAEFIPGCVDTEAKRLSDALVIPEANVSIDHRRSLPISVVVNGEPQPLYLNSAKFQALYLRR